jgi:hypothetical protein
MARTHSNGQVRKAVVKAKSYPEVIVDVDADFAAIKLAPGIEAKSFVKDGFVFCEDRRGRVIEVQVLNLSRLGKKKTRVPAA